jgi:glutamate-1-semialdehyde 2,1-aminomutase
VWDADGNRFLDFTGNHTSLLLGYGNPRVLRALKEQLERGTCFSGPTQPQLRLADLLCQRVPSFQQVRFTNSGTEATLNAIRAARAFTGRPKLAKVEGGYHGTHDVVEYSTRPDLEQAGAPEHPFPVPAVEGLPRNLEADVVIIPFNEPEVAQARILEQGSELAAVIVEPLLGSIGMVPAVPEYLQALREAATQVGALLIFDEVISFRLAPGGAQELYGVTPDLTCLGKCVGGGMPLGVFGGRAEVMALFDPSQGKPRVAHGGSFNANPMSMVAGIATLEELTPEVYERMNRLGEQLRNRLTGVLQELEFPAQVTGVGSLFGVHFTPQPVRDYRSAATADPELRHRFFLGLFNAGILMDPRGAGCLSAAMTEEQVDAFIQAAREVLHRLR